VKREAFPPLSILPSLVIPGPNYHEQFLNSITFTRQIAGKLSSYCESFSGVSTEPGSDWVGAVDFGPTYALARNLQLDCSCNVGVTRAFRGKSIRF
jgi:hypothetical protein